MGASAAYPIHFGRALAYVYVHWRRGDTMNDEYSQSLKTFAQELCQTFPAPGESAPEDCVDKWVICGFKRCLL